MRGKTLVLVMALLVVATFLVFWPLVAPLVVGAWAAHLARPLFAKLSRAMHGRTRAAGVLTAALVLLLAAPAALAITSLVPAARALVEELRGASGGRGALAALVTSGNAPEGKLDVVGLAKEYGASASKAAGAVATMGAEVAVGLFVFVMTFFALLVDSERAYAWVRERAPVEPPTLRRFADAFHQAGRGLLVGTGLTALVQGVLCGAIYAALGVPRAILLGLLSVVGALIPVTGPAIVWLPVAAGLALTGHPGKAVILVVLGVALVGTVDNVMRPWLSKRADIGLSTTLVLVGMFGGMAAFGTWGLLIGPLLLRLTMEAFDVAKEQGIFGRRRTVS
jgi:predicted PurR-regulated permease PerM